MSAVEGGDDSAVPPPPAPQPMAPAMSDTERRHGIAGMVRSIPTPSFAGLPGESVRTFRSTAVAYGTMYLQAYEGVLTPPELVEVVLSSMLKDKAAAWYQANREDLRGMSLEAVLQKLVDDYRDPLEKQRVADAIASLMQGSAESVRDYIIRWRSVLNEARVVGYDVTADMVWSCFKRGLNIRFKRALGSIDLVGGAEDQWPAGAESLARWEQRNPLQLGVGGSQPGQASGVSTQGHQPSSSSSSGHQANYNNKNTNSNKKKIRHNYGARPSPSASAGGGRQAGAPSSSGASSPGEGSDKGPQCYRCKKRGHMQWDCPLKLKEQKGE